MILCILVVPAGADTVFLNNQTAIDGVIKARHERTLELQIGKIGRIFVALDMIDSIEKNDRDGSVSDSALALAGVRRLVEETEAAGVAERPPAAPDPDDAAVKRCRTKDDVEPELRAEIERQMYDYTREKRKFRVRATQRLMEIGEPALPFLLEVVNHDNPQVRIATMEIFARNGTDLVIKDAIGRLEDENEYVRKTANEALVKITGKDFEFHFDGAEARRQEAAQAWRTWYEEQARDAAAAEEAAMAAAAAGVDGDGERAEATAQALDKTPKTAPAAAAAPPAP
ncbi:MAG TPA: hypothetical protein DCM87_14200 [Planctomycetes bacterium]|nr:hypothetical protein [Planctomycetota bacterium]